MKIKTKLWLGFGFLFIVVIFLNKKAEQVFNLDLMKTVGKNAKELTKTNELLELVLSSKAGAKPMKVYADNRESFF